MRRPLRALAVIVTGLAVLLPPAVALAAPKTSPSTARPRMTTVVVNRAAIVNMRSNTHAAASFARAKRLAKMRRGGRLYVVQARNPLWGRTGLMTPAAAASTTLSLRYQGISAHVHNLGSAGSFVHYGMLHWQGRGAFTDLRYANAVASALRAHGLQARVLTRVY